MLYVENIYSIIDFLLATYKTTYNSNTFRNKQIKYLSIFNTSASIPILHREFSINELNSQTFLDSWKQYLAEIKKIKMSDIGIDMDINFSLSRAVDIDKKIYHITGEYISIIPMHYLYLITEGSRINHELNQGLIKYFIFRLKCIYHSILRSEHINYYKAYSPLQKKFVYFKFLLDNINNVLYFYNAEKLII